MNYQTIQNFLSNAQTLAEKLFQPEPGHKATTYASTFTIDPLHSIEMDSEFIKHRIRIMAEQNIIKGVLPYLGKSSIFLRPFIMNAQMDGYYFKLNLIQPIEEVSERPVIFKIIEEISSLPSNVFKCAYCKGFTYNDRYGNCSACGGERQEIITPVSTHLPSTERTLIHYG